MNLELLPYLLLLFAILAGWQFEARISMAVLGVAIIVGLSIGRLTPLALLWTGVLGLSIWLSTKKRLKNSLRILCRGIFLVLAVALSNHLVSGFNNFPIFQDIQFSPDSIPFTMYLNFDKTLCGLFILLFYVKRNQPPSFTKEHFFTSIQVLGLLVILLIPIALMISYVRLDLKLPELGWLWGLNNLFFVCLAEEGLFRGFIQKGISNILPKAKKWSVVSVVVAAVLFALTHYRGGISYVMLAGIAGLFYGYAYKKTDRLESAMIVHFGFNLVHFLFFSYPALLAK